MDINRKPELVLHSADSAPNWHGESAPILALHGADAPHVNGARLPAWADETSDSLVIVQCEGDHFFFERQEGAVMQLMIERLRAQVNPSEVGTR